MPAKTTTIYNHNGMAFIEHGGFDDDEHIIDDMHVLQYQHGKAVLICFNLEKTKTEVKNYRMLHDGSEHIVCACGKDLVWTKKPEE
jgi:hypothetical protein